MDNFAELLTKLFEFYGKPITMSQIDAYDERLGFYDFATIEEACRQTKFNNIKYLPSPNELAKECDRVRDQKKAHAQRLDSAVINSLTTSKRGDDAYLKKCKALMSAVVEKKISGIELADEMLAMDRQYPGRGWHKSARDVLTRFYKKAGINDFERLLP
jgi:hypothetical protein